MNSPHYITHEELLDVIRQKVKELGGTKQFSQRFNINRTVVNYILSGSRKITFSLTLALGYRVKLVYFKMENKQNETVDSSKRERAITATTK